MCFSAFVCVCVLYVCVVVNVSLCVCVCFCACACVWITAWFLHGSHMVQTEIMRDRPLGKARGHTFRAHVLEAQILGFPYSTIESRMA